MRVRLPEVANQFRHNWQILQVWFDNRRVGMVKLSAGTFVFKDPRVTMSTAVFVQPQITGNTYKVTIQPGVSWTVTSSSGTDTSTLFFIKEDIDFTGQAS